MVSVREEEEIAEAETALALNYVANQLEKTTSMLDLEVSEVECKIVERALSVAIGLFDCPELLIHDNGMDEFEDPVAPLTQRELNDNPETNSDNESLRGGHGPSSPRNESSLSKGDDAANDEVPIESEDLFATEKDLGTQIPDDEIELDDDHFGRDEEIPSSGSTVTPQGSQAAVQNLGKAYAIDDPDKRFCSVEALRNAPPVSNIDHVILRLNVLLGVELVVNLETKLLQCQSYFAAPRRIGREAGSVANPTREVAHA